MWQKATESAYELTAQLARFRDTYGAIPILAAGPAKVVQVADERALQRGIHWAQALRCVLIVTPDQLVVQRSPALAPLYTPASGIAQPADMVIPIDTIQEAIFKRVRQGWFQGAVLTLRLNDATHYHLGLMADTAWEQHLPFPLTVETATLTWSWASVLARLVVVAFVLSGIALVWLLLRGR